MSDPVGRGPVAAAAADEIFAAPVGEWQRVSPRLATARRIPLAIFAGALGTVGVAAALVTSSAVPLAGLAALAVLVGWQWLLIGRQVAAIGWVERDDDLAVTSGVLWRRMVVVPYGRMQFVDVTAGPLERWLGIASVQLHTATPVTSAAIPGLTPAEATALRDRLSALGEARAAGL